MEREAAFAALGVSRETELRIDRLVAMLVGWNERINLVAPATLRDVWRRHILDSGQLWRLKPPGAKRWVDLGSGGGFPGLVIAAIAAEEQGLQTVRLIESDSRKAAFLREAAREMQVDVDIDVSRIEIAEPASADVVSARALAPLPKLIDLVERHRGPGGIALLLKGAKVREELTVARQDWMIDAHIVSSLSDSSGSVVVVTEVQRAADRS